MSELQQREQGQVEQTASGVIYWIETCFWIGLTLVLALAAAVFAPDMLGHVLPAWYLITPLAILTAIVSGGIGLRKIRQRRQGQSSVTSDAPVEARQSPAVQPGDERELLLAIRDNGGSITPAEAVMETSLSVREADRMLSELAGEGHLRLESEEGSLFYVLPGRRTPALDD